MGLVRIVNTATNSASRVTSFAATVGAFYIITIESTTNTLKNDSFSGCDTVFDYFNEQTIGSAKVRSRTLLVKATSSTVSISCPSGHIGYYYAKIT